MDSLVARIRLAWWGAECQSGLKVSGWIRLVVHGRLLIGRKVRMNSSSALNYVGGDKRISIWIGSGAELEIGDGSGLSNCTIVALQSVRILEGTLIGGGCEIYDSDFHGLTHETRAVGASAPVSIGPRAFVGARTMVLKGVTIGEGAVIGAGSVVTRDVPAREIWAGCPARKIRSL